MQSGLGPDLLLISLRNTPLQSCSMQVLNVKKMYKKMREPESLVCNASVIDVVMKEVAVTL